MRLWNVFRLEECSTLKVNFVFCLKLFIMINDKLGRPRTDEAGN